MKVLSAIFCSVKLLFTLTVTNNFHRGMSLGLYNYPISYMVLDPCVFIDYKKLLNVISKIITSTNKSLAPGSHCIFSVTSLNQPFLLETTVFLLVQDGI